MKRISRKLPQSPLEIKTALTTAKAKKDSNPPGRQVLKTDTAAELDTWTLTFNDKYSKVTDAQAEYNNYTPVKTDARDKCRQYCSQFMHAINFEIEQGVLKPGDRAYYGMDISTGNFLPLGSEAEIKESAALLVEGETLRVAAGGIAIIFPKKSDLEAAANDFNTKSVTHSNFADTLDIQKEAINVLAAETINFIKIMWNEIESTFAAETIESRRENSRAWGVVYANITVNIPVTIAVIDATTGLAIEGADATLENADLEEITDAEGNGEFFTPIEGSDVLKIMAAGYTPVEKTIDTSDGKALSLNIEMQKAA